MVAKNHSTSSKSRSISKIKKPTKKKPVKTTVAAKSRTSAPKKRTVTTKAKTTKSRKVTASKRKPVALQPVHKKMAGAFIVLAILAVGAVGVVNTVRSSISNAAAIAGPITGIAGKCLDNAGDKVRNNNKIQLFECNGTAAQKWNIPGDGTIRMQDYCLDVKYASKEERTPVQLYECNGTVAQKWVVKSDKTIVNPNSGLCLDDQYAKTQDGNPIWMYHCNGTDAQKWTLYTPVATTTAKDSDAATPTPVPTAPAATSSGPITGIGGKCLDNADNVIANHNKVQLYTCNNGASQKWTIPGDGTIRMQGYCLDVKYASTEERTPVQLYACNGTAAQKWVVKSNKTIVNPNTGFCLDDKSASTADGNIIWMYHCNGTDAQNWTVYTPIIGTTDSNSDSSTPVPTPTPTPTPTQESSSPAPSSSNLIFSDEFNGSKGSAPDAKKWVIYGGTKPARWGVECFVNDREHIYVDGQGHLVQTATYNPSGVPCSNGSGPYKSGGMSTGSATDGLFTFKYGTIEARIQVPCQSGRGMWPAWWADGTSWPKGGELDFLEMMKGSDGGYNAKQTLHGAKSDGSHWQLPYNNVSSTLWCKAFHTFGAIWSPGKIQFTIDGKVTHTITPSNMPSSGVWPFDTYKERLILDLQIGNYGGTVDNSTFPQSMIVDYVRVYGN